jgi:hypothetical protein
MFLRKFGLSVTSSRLHNLFRYNFNESKEPIKLGLAIIILNFTRKMPYSKFDLGTDCRVRICSFSVPLDEWRDSFIHLWLCSPSLNLGCFFSLLIFYTVDRTPWTWDQSDVIPLPAHRTTTNTEETHTDIHASSGIRTHDPNIWAGEDNSCPRPGSHCDRPNDGIVPWNRQRPLLSRLFLFHYSLIILHSTLMTASLN